MKIYHLYHSGVAIEDKNTLLVFDYYLDKIENTIIDNTKADNNKIYKEKSVDDKNYSGKTDRIGQKDLSNIHLSNGVIRKDTLTKFDNVYVFVTHRHSDHYNPVIFKWEQYNTSIKYILSDDIPGNNPSKKQNIYYMKKGEQISIDDINIFAYGSTDQGVSFLLSYDDKTIFHAGDLNWWHWSSFSEEQLQKEEDDFKKEVNKLKGDKIDIAFVPVDPRLKDNYYLAGEYFIKTIKPDIFVPIHFENEYNITEKFARKFSDCDTRAAIINKPGEEILY